MIAVDKFPIWSALSENNDIMYFIESCKMYLRYNTVLFTFSWYQEKMDRLLIHESTIAVKDSKVTMNY